MHKPTIQTVAMFEFPDFSGETPREVTNQTQNHALEEVAATKTTPPVDVPASQTPSDEDSIDMDKYKEEMFKLKQSILEDARKEAEAIKLTAKEEGYKTGYDEGFSRGKEQAVSEHAAELEKERLIFVEEVKDFIEKTEIERNRLTEIHMEGLKELAIAVAEKVINVSLKSSGEVIKNMLAAAIEKSKNKQWAKVYISSHDEALTLEGETDILDRVNSISNQVKVVVMENKPSGTCIIEFPDQIIDAGTETQLGNIRQILDVP